ncbi:MAG TPA: response regulator transcription factor [Flavipsychrobacter sp.]|jgi:DNA-binding NarL/FixJ family response regulator|nr:response regulator transcription factor [Flavipsychrobacter sp.]
MSIRIAIADDHPLLVEGLKKILPTFPGISLFGCYYTGKELLNGLEQYLPDVLLLDIHLPDKNGDELVPIILKKYPSLKILTLTNFDSTIYVHHMIAHGVLGYILKTATNEELIEAIQTVSRGEQYISDAMKEKMNDVDSKIRKAFSSRASLTPREKEILQLVVDGHTNPEIAQKLFLSVKTVDNYRTNIMMKLDVSNTAALVTKALRTGMAK